MKLLVETVFFGLAVLLGTAVAVPPPTPSNNSVFSDTLSPSLTPCRQVASSTNHESLLLSLNFTRKVIFSFSGAGFSRAWEVSTNAPTSQPMPALTLGHSLAALSCQTQLPHLHLQLSAPHTITPVRLLWVPQRVSPGSPAVPWSTAVERMLNLL